jgi:biotin carboxylase
LTENGRPVAVVLGGTNPHCALIANLQRRGYFTVLVDYYENPPAKSKADKHIRESTLDTDLVLALAKQENAALVISACVDQANVVAAYVAEQLGLPRPYSYHTALQVSQKPRMKSVLAAHGIPTAKYMVAKHERDLQLVDLVYPVVVKPGDSNGSKGVTRVDRPEQLLARFQLARSISRSGEVIVEEFCDGDDISVDCFVRDGKCIVLMLRRKYDFPGTSDTVINCYASVVPAFVSSTATARIHRVAEMVASAFELKTTSLLIQVMVDGDDVKVIELAARIGGGLSYRTIQMHTGFDILDATVDAWLNKPVAILTTPSDGFYVTSNIYALPGVFGKVLGYHELLRDGVVDELYFHKTIGMKIGASFSSSDRVCSFIVKGKTALSALEKVRQAILRLTVVDADGKDLTRRDIFLKEL